MAIFAILNLLKFVLIVAVLVMIGIVLIRSKKKRREQFNEAVHQLLEETDPNKNGNGQ